MLSISKKREMEVRALFQKFSVRPVAVAILDRPTLVGRVWTDGTISESSFVQMLRDNAARLQRRGCLHQKDLSDANRHQPNTPFAGKGRAWRKGVCEAGRKEIRRNFAEAKAMEFSGRIPADQRFRPSWCGSACSAAPAGSPASGLFPSSSSAKTPFFRGPSQAILTNPAKDAAAGEAAPLPRSQPRTDSRDSHDSRDSRSVQICRSGKDLNSTKSPGRAGVKNSENRIQRERDAAFDETAGSAALSGGILIEFHSPRKDSSQAANAGGSSSEAKSFGTKAERFEINAAAGATPGVRDMCRAVLCQRENTPGQRGESALFAFPAGSPRLVALVCLSPFSLAEAPNDGEKSSAADAAQSSAAESMMKVFGEDEAEMILSAFTSDGGKISEGSFASAADSPSSSHTEEHSMETRWRDDTLDLAAALGDEGNAAAAILDAATGEALYASKEAFRTFGIRGPFLGSTCLAPEASDAVRSMVSLAENPARCVRRVDRFGSIVLLNLFRNAGEMEAQRAAAQYGLTPSEEAEAMRMLAGLSCKESAVHSGLTPETIRQKRKGIYRKMGVTTHGLAVARMMNVRLPPAMVGRNEKAG